MVLYVQKNTPDSVKYSDTPTKSERPVAVVLPTEARRVASQIGSIEPCKRWPEIQQLTAE